MNSVYKPIIITATGVPYMQQSTYTVGLYSHSAESYVVIYTGRCVGDIQQNAVLRLDTILRDFAFTVGRKWQQSIQDYVPSVLCGIDDVLRPVEDGTAFVATKACVTVFDNNGVEISHVDDITVWAGWLAPWQKGDMPYYENAAVDLALVANDVVPHLPPIGTPRLWLGLSLMWFSNNKPVLALHDSSVQLNTFGNGCFSAAFTLQNVLSLLSSEADIDGGESDEEPVNDRDGGTSGVTPSQDLDGGDSSAVVSVITSGPIMLRNGANNVVAAVIDDCAAPYYVAWYMPSGGWMCFGMEGNIVYGGTPVDTTIKDVAGGDKVLQLDVQPVASLHSGFVTRDEYNVLCTMNYAREVYLYDTNNDRGIWCNVDNRSIPTAGSQRWINQPFEVTLKEAKHTTTV